LGGKIMNKEERHGFTCLIAGAICIALAPIFAKLAVDYDKLASATPLSPTGSALWRMLFSVPVYIAMLFYRKQRLVVYPFSWRQTWGLWLAGLFFALDLAFWHASFELTSVGNSTLLANLSAVVASVMGFVWFKEKFTKLFVVGGVVSLVGVAGLVGFSFSLGGETWIGDLLALIAALLYGAYLVSLKVILRRMGSIELLLWISATSSIFLLIVAQLTSAELMAHSWQSWLCLFGLAVSSQVVGQLLITVALAALPVGLTSVVLLIQPILVVGLGWWILGETMTPLQSLWALVVLAGIYMAKKATTTSS
jgi:drug/metabolite transporter (DMT)-like permease